MNIISKFKDYYDYLSGIWGVDPLLTYVRQGEMKPDLLSDYAKIRIYIGGILIEGFYYKGNFYYGENLNQFSKPIPPYMTHKQGYTYQKLVEEYGLPELNTSNLVWISPAYLKDVKYTRPLADIIIHKTPIVDPLNINNEENCPVIVKVNKNIFRNCSLKDLNISSILDAETVYHLISDWLSLQRTKKEDRDDSRTNEQKIESFGFDKKTSFRPNLK